MLLTDSLSIKEFKKFGETPIPQWFKDLIEVGETPYISKNKDKRTCIRWTYVNDEIFFAIEKQTIIIVSTFSIELCDNSLPFLLIMSSLKIVFLILSNSTFQLSLSIFQLSLASLQFFNKSFMIASLRFGQIKTSWQTTKTIKPFFFPKQDFNISILGWGRKFKTSSGNPSSPSSKESLYCHNTTTSLSFSCSRTKSLKLQPLLPSHCPFFRHLPTFSVYYYYPNLDNDTNHDKSDATQLQIKLLI